MNLKKPLTILAIAILIVLLLTNPSRSNFASYLHSSSVEYIGRDKNYFIFSIYSIRIENIIKRYYGVFGNFYLIDDEFKNADGKVENKQKTDDTLDTVRFN